jgi:hypothetical protein
MKKVLDLLEYEDLNEGLKVIADHSSMEVVKKLLQYHRGERIYIPMIKTMKSLLKKYIKYLLSLDKKIDIRIVSKEIGSSQEHISVLIREHYTKDRKKS